MRRLLLSCSGPTGDLEREEGEAEPAATSSSKLRLSFLSSPASLPAENHDRERQAVGEGRAMGGWGLGRSGAGEPGGAQTVCKATASRKEVFGVRRRCRRCCSAGTRLSCAPPCPSNQTQQRTGVGLQIALYYEIPHIHGV